MSIKLAKVCYNYGPYHLARIGAFARKCATMGWEVFGIELARSEEEYPWQTTIDNFPCEIISVTNDCSVEKASFKQSFTKIISILNKTAPDVVAISGYSHPLMLSVLSWCLWHRKPAILLSETAENDEQRRWWKEKIKQWIILKYRAALVGGQPHKRYLIKLGMSSTAIHFGYDVVENGDFHPDLIKSLPNPLKRPFFLAINRFVSKKNLPFLLTAYTNYRQKLGSDSWDLVLCGDGELCQQLKAQISDHNLAEYVHLPGFLQQQQLLPYFAHASCFIHASIQEQWGLVVNEAMAAGLPILLSNRCGCYEDLILEGVNGFGFNPENTLQLAELMSHISSGEIDIHKMGQASLQHIHKFSPSYFAQGLLAIVKYLQECNYLIV